MKYRNINENDGSKTKMKAYNNICKPENNIEEKAAKAIVIFNIQ